MGRVVHLMNVSVDGYVDHPQLGLDWTAVDDELHGFFNDHERELGAMVYGRRLWETMAGYWPTAEADPDATPVMREYARLWNAVPKVVVSRTLDRVEHGARLERELVPVLRELRDTVDGEIDLGGPTTAVDAYRAGLVDAVRLVIHPIVLGRGTRFFPELDTPLRLRPTDERTFANGARYLAFDVER